MDTTKLCISVDKMAESLGVSLTVAYRLAKDKNFYPAKKIGGRIIISVTELKKWVGEQGMPKKVDTMA